MNGARMIAVGTTDDHTTCECCGRTDLKRTVIMRTLDADGNQIAQSFFGTTCAAKASGRKLSEIKAEAAEGDQAAREAEERARRARARELDAEWQAWLDAHSDAPDRLSQIEDLGGWAAAHRAFNAARS